MTTKSCYSGRCSHGQALPRQRLVSGPEKMSDFRVFLVDAGGVFGDNKGAMKMQSTTTKYHAHAPLLGEVTSSDCVFIATGKGSFISGGAS